MDKEKLVIILKELEYILLTTKSFLEAKFNEYDLS